MEGGEGKELIALKKEGGQGSGKKQAFKWTVGLETRNGLVGAGICRRLHSCFLCQGEEKGKGKRVRRSQKLK